MTTEPSAQSSALDALAAACAAAGLRGRDYDSALDAYVAGGTLSRVDRGALDVLDAASQEVCLSSRYGSDGARVAAIAYREQIGGTR